jgi:hypothetical protein
MRTCVLAALSFMTALSAQDPPALTEAKALDKDIQKLPNLPESTRDAAFRQMLQRIPSHETACPAATETKGFLSVVTGGDNLITVE